MPLTVKMLGVSELVVSMESIQKKVDLATVAATKRAQSEIIKNVKSRLRGRPRWNHRGRSRIYGADVNIPGMAKNSPRGGGPGKFTGMLYSGVGGKKNVVSIAGTVKGGVGVGGSRLRPNNLKKRYLEAKYPFFEPGVKAAEAKIGEVYATAWKAAIERRGGL